MRLRKFTCLQLFGNKYYNLSGKCYSNNSPANKWILINQQSMKISQSSTSSAKPKVNEVSPVKRHGLFDANQNHVIRDEIHEVLSAGTNKNENGYLAPHNTDIKDISKYYFDGRGKGIRPRLCLTLADVVNFHLFGLDHPTMVDEIMKQQRTIAHISEMYHTGSLYHDDVIDKSEERRSQPSVNLIWGTKRAVFSGDYVVSMANKILADLNNDEVTITMSRIVSDLVTGEFQQIAKTKKDKQDRFQMYIDKSYNKTASVLANSCRAVTILATSRASTTQDLKHIENSSFYYGKNLGIAFQLMDDWLDFAATAEQLGKPAAADLKLGIATAPVLFAAERYPEMEALISRRFSNEGDVEKAFEMVHDSDGMQETKILAKKYAKAAIDCIANWRQSESKQGLNNLMDAVIDRMN